MDNYRIQNKRVYRDAINKDKKLLEDYKEGTTILTTTFLSTSTNSGVAHFFCTSNCEDDISIFCTYNIKNTGRCAALDIESIAWFRDEKEVLILRYVPFIITSIKTTEDGRRMNICLNQYSEERPKSSQLN